MVRVILGWAAILGGITLVAAAGLYLPAALGTADVSRMPVAFLFAIGLCGIATMIVGWLLLRGRSRPR